MNSQLAQKLKDLPRTPGVYFHKDKAGIIIYVGKAAKLNARVRQYFQKSRLRDLKTDALVAEIADIDWMEVDSELEALFLEAEMVRRYMPRYNILLRDDKSLSYIRIDYDSNYPTVTTTRRPLDDKARYFGPYFSTYQTRQALRALRRVFPFATNKNSQAKRPSLHYHLGLDPGLETGQTSLADYRTNLRRLMKIISGQQKTIERQLNREMKLSAANHDFELAAKKRNQLRALADLRQKVIFSDKEFLDLSKDHALAELVELLSLAKFPRTIEGYDISHMSGSNVVASQVVFTNGVSDKGRYRKYKMSRQRNDDFYNMSETITRRLSETNIAKWGKPDLVLIDGGKGQLDAAVTARDKLGLNLPFIGLAKRQEQIVIDKQRSGVELNQQVLERLNGYVKETDNFVLVNLPHSTNLIKLLQRIRDESHRFAVSYHSSLKIKTQTKSQLDDIVGIGPVSRKKLIKHFGSLRAVAAADYAELTKLLGAHKAAIVKNNLGNKT